MKQKTADTYYESVAQWRKEIRTLRKIVLSTGLEETVKWGMPVYTLHGKNVVGIGSFKSYFGLWFFQGALLKDPRQVLINAQQGRTAALRQWRFTSVGDIDEDRIREYVLEAKSNQEKGIAIKHSRHKKLIIPDDLLEILDNDPALRKAFDRLTAGRKREYAEYIAEAKRETTRTERIKKISLMIMEGRGLNDGYQ
jgi:uncharacterized protein YdeI (YjbR/CyaY-like superfamily)